MKLFYTLLLSLICITAAFSATYPANVQNVLQKAGQNRPELEKVLKHYRNDSLKFKAVCFLIGNMDIHVARTYYWADSLNNKVPFDELGYPDYETAVKSFNAMSAKTKLHPVQVKVPDVECMTAKYLIRNIDQAFKLWQKPWAQNLTFEQFCEYLLPYRIATESMQDWRLKYDSVFCNLSDRYTALSLKQAVTKFNNNLAGWFFNSGELERLPEIFSGPLNLLFRKQGACPNMVLVTAYMLRSQGIPCAIDFTPAWATSTGAHYWDVSFNEVGDELPFDGAVQGPNQFIMKREPSKVLRMTYSRQPESLAMQFPDETIPDNFLRLTNYTDVTHNYWKVFDLKARLFPKYLKRKISLVSVFNGFSWRPVFWGRNKAGYSIYQEMSCGVVYLPLVMQDHKTMPAGYPVLLQSDGSCLELRINKQKRISIRIDEKVDYLKYRQGKKYTLFYWDDQWKKMETKMIDEGKFLAFDHVPSNTLYLLVPEYSQHKERPFTVDASSGGMSWW